jgi:hypothetical protein
MFDAEEKGWLSTHQFGMTSCLVDVLEPCNLAACSTNEVVERVEAGHLLAGAIPAFPRSELLEQSF